MNVRNSFTLKQLRLIELCSVTFFLLIVIVSSLILLDRMPLWIDNSGWGELKSISIKGTDRLTKNEVFVASGLRIGAQLDSIDLNQIAENIESIPTVELARVIKKIPGRISILIREREPVALLLVDNFVLIDRYGKKFPPVYGGEQLDLPSITQECGNGAPVQPQTVHTAAEVLGYLMEEYPALYRNISEMVICEQSSRIRFRQGGAELVGVQEFTAENLNLLNNFFDQHSHKINNDTRYIRVLDEKEIVVGTKPYPGLRNAVNGIFMNSINSFQIHFQEKSWLSQ